MTTDTHVHSWVIDPPHGPTSEGVCNLCNTTRSFHNALDNVLLEKYKGSVYNSHKDAKNDYNWLGEYVSRSEV